MSAIIIRSEQELEAFRQRANKSKDRGTQFSGMTYEEGILAVLDWLEDPDISIEEII